MLIKVVDGGLSEAIERIRELTHWSLPAIAGRTGLSCQTLMTWLKKGKEDITVQENKLWELIGLYDEITGQVLEIRETKWENENG